MTQNPLSYYTARKLIRSGDVGLCRGTKLFSRYGRSEYSHAWMFIWWNDALMIVELREWTGGRAITASAAVRERPSLAVDVYRPKYAGQEACEKTINAMIRKAGKPYNYRGLLIAAAFRLPILNRFWQPSFNDEAKDGYPEFCSQAVSNALRAGGLDPVQNADDAMTEPGDLGRSVALDYLCTIKRETKPELAVAA